MVVYRITAGDYTYIGMTTRDLAIRINEHNYRLKDPAAHQQYSRTRFYRKLRELGVDKITEDNCQEVCEGGRLEEQLEIDKIPVDYSLNSARSVR